MIDENGPITNFLKIPVSHPIWKIVQSFIALVGIAVFAIYGLDHVPALDLDSAAGLGGAAIASKLIYQLIKG